MKKNFVLDTNVLLHDPNSILNFQDNHVLIPIEVIEEIDRFKRESSELVAKVHDALYASKVVSYAQGLDLMRSMSDKKGWKLDLGAIAAIGYASNYFKSNNPCSFSLGLNRSCICKPRVCN